MLLAFNYEGYFPKAEVNHKDENKLNNCIENLEWCTAKYNANYGTRTKRCTRHLYDKKENFKGIKSNKEKTNNRKVIDKDTNKIYNSIIECAKDKGINYKTLQANISGTRKKNRFNIEYY